MNLNFDCRTVTVILEILSKPVLGIYRDKHLIISYGNYLLSGAVH